MHVAVLKACTRGVNSWLPRMRGVNGSRSPRGVVGIRTTPVVHSLYPDPREIYSNLVVDSGGSAHPAREFLPGSMRSSFHTLARIRPGSVRSA